MTCAIIGRELRATVKELVQTSIKPATRISNRILRAECKRLVQGKPSRVFRELTVMKCACCAQNIVEYDELWYHLEEPPVRDGRIQLRIACLTTNWRHGRGVNKAVPYILEEAFG